MDMDIVSDEDVVMGVLRGYSDTDEDVVMGVLRRRHGGQRHGCKWHMGVRWR